MMKTLVVFAIICCLLPQLETAYRTPFFWELKQADPCSAANCNGPSCRCSNQTLIKPEFEGHEKQIPQFITVTFDDAVTVLNYEQYQELFADLYNPDLCEVRGCFYVSHEYTDYSKVNALYNEGHEIALHSITHGLGADYWRNASVELLLKEFGQQLNMMEKYAKVQGRHIRGMRLPFLQMAGNNSFIAARKLGLLYDSSWPTRYPTLWPYTLDYLSTQDCPMPPCPTVSVPGFWELPMVSWVDNKGYLCSMLDGCVNVPQDDADSVCEWMKLNFVRHYKGNRAPFGMYLHAAWFGRNPNYLKGFRKFLEYVNTLPDVYVVTPSAVIQYMRHPTLDHPFRGCFKKPSASCQPVLCTLPKEPSGELRYMTVCDKCPEAYPWLDNPLGEKRAL